MSHRLLSFHLRLTPSYTPSPPSSSSSVSPALSMMCMRLVRGSAPQHRPYAKRVVRRPRTRGTPPGHAPSDAGAADHDTRGGDEEERDGKSEGGTRPDRGRPAPRSWHRTSSSLQRMQERGLSFSSVLERGPDRSIAGRQYDERITRHMRGKCVLWATQWDRYFGPCPQQELLLRAVTHKSYGTGKVLHNEQLAFVGKYVLEMAVAQWVVLTYGGAETDDDGGGRAGRTHTAQEQVHNAKDMNLLRAVYCNESTLHLVGAYDWGLENVLRCYGYDKMKAGKRAQILAHCALATVGAVYSNLGPTVAIQFIHENLLQRTPGAIFSYLLYNADPVKVLYDILFAQGFIVPSKTEEQEKGNAYSCSFHNHGDMIGHGSAPTAQEARNLAALNALSTIGARVPDH